MSGAWEMEQPSVLVAILTREIVSMRWAMGLRNLQMPAASGIIAKSGMPFDYARNQACEAALGSDFQWLCFLDDDVIPPGDAIARLMSHGKDVVSGLYYRRAHPLVPVMMFYDDKRAAQWVTNWNPPQCLLDVDLVGAGCLLIHRRVLERMPPPWFVWELGRSDLPADRQHLSEDFSFCRRAKEHGFQICVDTSIRCEHVGLGVSGETGFGPA